MAKNTLALETLQQEAADSLRAYREAGDDEKTAHLRETARLFVDAREHFFNKEGEPDWRGRTYAYRQWVSGTMSLANIRPEDHATVQGAIRYHAGSALRAKLGPEKTAALGLRADAPVTRAADSRRKSARVLNLFGSAGAAITDPEEIGEVLDTVAATLARISLDSVHDAVLSPDIGLARHVSKNAERAAGIAGQILLASKV